LRPGDPDLVAPWGSGPRCALGIRTSLRPGDPDPYPVPPPVVYKKKL